MRERIHDREEISKSSMKHARIICSVYITMWIKERIRSNYTKKSHSISLWARLCKNWTTIKFAPHNVKIVLWDKFFLDCFISIFIHLSYYVIRWFVRCMKSKNETLQITDEQIENFQQRRFILDEYFTIPMKQKLSAEQLQQICNSCSKNNCENWKTAKLFVKNFMLISVESFSFLSSVLRNV